MVGSPFGNKKISNNASILFKKFISIARHIYDKNDGSWIGLSHGPPPPPHPTHVFHEPASAIFYSYADQGKRESISQINK